jgi:hypothetical protein
MRSVHDTRRTSPTSRLKSGEERMGRSYALYGITSMPHIITAGGSCAS